MDKKKVSPTGSAKKVDDLSKLSSKGGGTNIRVVLRVRPMNPKELAMMEVERVDSKGNKIRDNCTDFNPTDPTAVACYTPIEKEGYEKHAFNFDYVFDCSTNQQKVYEIAADPIMEGTN